MNSYISGSLVRETGSFADITGAPADPDTVTLKYRTSSPGALSAITALTYAGGGLTRSATGVYYHDFDTTGYTGSAPQTWQMEWGGTGTVVAIADDSFQVTAPQL